MRFGGPAVDTRAWSLGARARHATAAVVLGLIAAAAGAPAARGDGAIVTAVVDGDTIRVARDGRVQTVRLIGIDTPELRDHDHLDAPAQPFAREAADYTTQTLARHHVRLAFENGEHLDRYARLLAYVFLDDGTFFNRELVRLGYARAYTRYPCSFAKEFRAAQDEARAARRGLWATAATAGDTRGPIVGNRQSHIYHRPGQQHYDQVAERNRVYFTSEAAALDAGYEPARR